MNCNFCFVLWPWFTYWKFHLIYLTFFPTHGCSQDTVFWDIKLHHWRISFSSFWKHCNSEEETQYLLWFCDHIVPFQKLCWEWMSIVDICESPPPQMLYHMFTEIQACSGLLHCLLHPVIQFWLWWSKVVLQPFSKY